MKQISPHVQDHIDLVAKHEQDFLERRKLSERIGDSIGGAVGSLTFVAFHVLWFAGWLLINTTHQKAIPHFDAYPFPLLDLCVALEAIFLASFIVMRQQRMSRRSDERDHFILQILMLTEKEVTASLSMGREMAKKMGLHRVAEDEELEELSLHTSIEDVAENLQQSLIDP